MINFRLTFDKTDNTDENNNRLNSDPTGYKTKVNDALVSDSFSKSRQDRAKTHFLVSKLNNLNKSTDDTLVNGSSFSAIEKRKPSKLESLQKNILKNGND